MASQVRYHVLKWIPNAALSAPQATLMTTIAQGIFNSSMDWDYILIGVGVGVVAIIVNLILKSTTASLTLPPLAVGMGIYLPLQHWKCLSS